MASLREAAAQALEAMDKATRYMSFSDHRKLNEAITALRAALEQPEQAPVAWMRPDETMCFVREVAEAEGYQPLFTHPPRREWQVLSNGELYTAYITATNQTLRPQDERLAFAFARAIEAALKEKNHE